MGRVEEKEGRVEEKEGRVEEKEGRVEVGKDGLRTQTGKFAVQTEVPSYEADFGDFCLPSVLVRRAGYGYCGLGTQTGKFAVQKSGESEFPPTEEVIRGYKPLLQGNVVIICGLFVNITGIYKVIESFTIARLETSPAFEVFMSFCPARRLGCRWFW